MQQLKIVASDRVKDNAAFMDFVRRLPETFNHEGTVIHSGRNVLREIDVKDLGVEGIDRVMVKRFHGLLWFQQIQNTFFCKPKGRKAFDSTSELIHRGFTPARELALVEVWRHGLYQYAFYVAEMVQGERLTKLIRRLKDENQQVVISQIIHQYATLVKNLHERGVLYRDLNGGNVICRQDAPGGQWNFFLVDTDRARFYPADRHLDLKTVIKDLILMKPELGTNELFQEEYLRQRGLYTPEAAASLQQAQFARYDRKNRWYRKLWRKYRKFYHRLVKE